MEHKLIQGGSAVDNRGTIRFVNDFNMSAVKRFYLIRNANLDLVRGWRAHRIEQRWFYVIAGSFQFNLIKIDDWEKPDRDLAVEQVILESLENKILHVPQGFATAFKAIEPNSEMLVYADNSLEHSKFDDYTFDLNYFTNSNFNSVD